jgi:uncharacterized protein YcbK (DUF882 family)
VHVGNARLKTRRLFVAHAGYSCGLALLAFLFGSKALQNAVAEGDTRTITMHHIHTEEDIAITYKRDGRYDEEALAKLNWFLRDWRRGEQTHMDPRLIDLVWEVQREAGNKEPIQIVCGYRSPQTNEMLRHHSASSGVARFSQHMLGRAMDFYIPGIDLEHLREIGLRLQRGGVGFYPTSGSPFVHMDVGGIRMWPRMTHDQLARVFPDGRTVYLPTDGRPLSGFALALADVRKRGGELSEKSIDAARSVGVSVDTVVASNERPHANPFAKLLGLGKKDDDDEDDADVAIAPAGAPTPAVAAAPKHPILAAIEQDAQAAEKATAKVAVKVADAASKARFIRTADAEPAPPASETRPVVVAQAAPAPNPAAAPVPVAAAPSPVATAAAGSSPSQIIAARGYWQGPQDGTYLPPGGGTVRPRRAAATPSDADTTASVGQFAGARDDDRAAPDLALAYAEQPGRAGATANAPSGIAALRAAAASPQPAAEGTTIAMKRVAHQFASAVVSASATSVAVVKAGARFENPWLRAIVLSPSVHGFLTTMALGARDFRSLAALMVKPKSSVMMTFAADPNPGLDHDHFSGTAIVFVTTVSYPTHTAALQ